MFPIYMVSMQLACKMEENDPDLISYQDIDENILAFGLENFKQLEKLILEELEFQVNMITPYDLIHFLLDTFLNNEFDFFESKNQEEQENYFKVKIYLSVASVGRVGLGRFLLD